MTKQRVFNCRICNYRLDSIWVEMGVDVHPTCEDKLCEHGEPRGTRYCALCRKAATTIKGQMTIDDRPPVERNTVAVGIDHPATSVAAANRALPSSGSKRRMVLEAIKESDDGMCDWELERLFNWKHESASACRRSLVKDGWLADSGSKRPVPDTGNQAIVWMAV